MYFKKLFAMAVAISTCALSTPALAGDARLGFMLQDIELPGIGGIQKKEASEAISLDYVFDSPDWLNWLPLEPRPYIGGTANLSGKTSYGGAGLLVQPKITDSLYGEFGFGLVAHNGTIEIPTPSQGRTASEAMELVRRNATEIEFGSRILFRIELAVGYEVNEDWAVEMVLEHISHGKILSSRSNEGLDAAGLRVARRF